MNIVQILIAFQDAIATIMTMGMVVLKYNVIFNTIVNFAVIKTSAELKRKMCNV